MRSLPLLPALLIFSGLGVWASEAPRVGSRDFVFQDSTRGRKLVTHIWYPIQAGTLDVRSSSNPGGGPFLPATTLKDAPLPPGSGRFPVILLSHGSGGKAIRLFWLAERLVRGGMVVLAVDHPGNQTGDNSADGMMRVWERPRDLSFALDRLLEVPEFKARLDPGKVAAAGHSAGGTTALLLGGARLSWNRFTSPIPFCEGSKDPYYALQCKQLKSIDPKAYPRASVEADYSDPRITAVVALDPGFARSFDGDSLTKLGGKARYFLAEKLNAPQDEIYSREFARSAPAGLAETVPGSFHMTFLQPCKTDFPADDPELQELCVGNSRRPDIQQRVASESLAFMKAKWAATGPR